MSGFSGILAVVRRSFPQFFKSAQPKCIYVVLIIAGAEEGR
jgi:hypothetical protein